MKSTCVVRDFWQIYTHTHIDNLQPTNSNIKLLPCYGIFLTSRNLTCTRIKKHPNPAMTQDIREHSRNPPHPKV